MKEEWNDFNRMSGRLFEGVLVRAFDATLSSALLDHPMEDSEMRGIVNGSPALQVLEEISQSLNESERIAKLAEKYGISEETVRGIGLGLEIASVAFAGYIQGMDELSKRKAFEETSRTE